MMNINFGKLQFLEGSWINFYSGSWLFACGCRCVLWILLEPRPWEISCLILGGVATTQ